MQKSDGMSERWPASKPHRILVVDDEQDILDIQVRVLKTAGHLVDTACDGAVALQKLTSQDYDLIITNMRMPILDGRSFYVRVCSSHPHLSRRVIFCTGDIASADTLRFLSSAGVTVLFKPFALCALVDTVSRILDSTYLSPEVVRKPVARPELALATP